MKTERNTASQFCGTRFSGSPEDTQILAKVAMEKPGDQRRGKHTVDWPCSPWMLLEHGVVAAWPGHIHYCMPSLLHQMPLATYCAVQSH